MIKINSKKEIENKLREHFSQEKDVLAVYLFGSFAQGKDNQFSDVDVAVLLDFRIPPDQYTSQCLHFMNQLSILLKREVDVVILNKADTFIKYQVLKNGQRILEFDMDQTRSFEARAVVEYCDYLPIRQKLEKAFIAHLKKA